MKVAYVGAEVSEDMQGLLGIPVINPAKAALKLAESLVAAGGSNRMPPKLHP